MPDDEQYPGNAIWLTVDALGFYDQAERIKAEQKLGDSAYWIDGTDMLVRMENFTRAELLEWVRTWLGHHDMAVTTLVACTYASFQGQVPDLDAAFVAYEQMSDDAERVYVDPDTFDEISSATETGHRYKLALPRELLAQIQAMDEHEAEELTRGLARLADDPPPGARRLSA